MRRTVLAWLLQSFQTYPKCNAALQMVFRQPRVQSSKRSVVQENKMQLRGRDGPYSKTTSGGLASLCRSLRSASPFLSPSERPRTLSITDRKKLMCSRRPVANGTKLYHALGDRSCPLNA